VYSFNELFCPTVPLTGKGGAIGGGMSAGSASIGVFELPQMTHAQWGIVIYGSPRGRAIGFSTSPPLPVWGGGGGGG
jgi:hypothetical protein